MNFIGLDIGGTNIRGILFDGKKIRAVFRAKTPKIKKEFVKTLKSAVEKLASGKEIKNIGVGAAGIVSKTKVVFSPNIPYLKNFDFRSIFPAVSLKVDNDARAFLRGELRFVRGNKKVLAFTIGTGIGRAFAGKGKVEKIKKFEYPEKWEKEYQRLRESRKNEPLAVFLAGRLAKIAKKYKPDTAIIGGGLAKNKKFFALFKKELKKETEKRGLKMEFKKAVSDNSAALGAALLFK